MNFEDCFHLVDTVNIGAPLTIDILHEYAVSLGVHMFDSDQDCPSLWIIGNRAEGTAIIFEALYRDEDTKARILRAIGGTLRADRYFDIYATLSEAWFVNVPEGGDTTTPVSEREDRREALMIMSRTRDEGRSSRFIITRFPGRRSALSERQDENTAHSKGRMWELLEDAA
jgi:hypothetical protein